MCRLIGFVSPVPTTLGELIGQAQCSTFQQLSRLHADGWGTAWLTADGGVDQFKVARPGRDDANLTSVMVDAETRSRIVHLRMATDGMPVRPANSHPFIADGIAFAHNGSMVPSAGLVDGLSDDVLTGVRGDTDSELYLAVIRQLTREGASLSNAAYDAATRLRALYPHSSLNAMILSADEFVVVHANTGAAIPYDDFEASGLGDDLPDGHLDGYYQLSYLQRDDGAVAFSSTGIDKTGWTALPPESVTTVDLGTWNLHTRLVGVESRCVLA